MPDSDQTVSNDDSLDAPIEPGNSGVQPSDDDSAVASTHSKSSAGLRFCGWLGVSLVLALLLGVVFSALPARFRLLGLLGIAQGFAVGAVISPVTKPFRMHLSKLAAIGGFVAGAASVTFTAILWWNSWAKQLEQSVKPRPDAALAAQMLAQMKEPEDADPEQLKAYNESRRQFSEFLDAEAAPPETDFAAWLAHRASSLTMEPTAAIGIGLLELLLAGVASSLIARSTADAPFCSKCQNWRRVVRSQNFTAPLPSELSALLTDFLQDSETSASIQLLGCECQCRPVVNVDCVGGGAGQKLADIGMTEDQFLSLSQLIDEAQGIAARRLLANDGRLKSPFFIFVKDDGRLDDLEVLRRFGLEKYRRLQTVPPRRRAVIADSGEWKLLADDCGYTLWFMDSTRPTIGKIAEQFDVFACSVGDTDESFDFIYYVGGSLVRKYTVTDPHFDGGSVVEDVGEPLSEESNLLGSGQDKLTIVLGIADSLGINVQFEEADFRIYGSVDETF